MANRIIFDASIDKGLFRASINEMKGAVDSFLNRAKNGFASFSEKLGQVSQNFEAPKIETEHFDEAAVSLGRVAEKFNLLEESALSASVVLASFDLSGTIKTQFDEVNSSVMDFSSGLEIADQSVGFLANAVTIASADFGQIKTNIQDFRKTVDVAKSAITKKSAAQSVFNKKAKANPIGLIITAIALLVAGIIALIKNWDDVKAAVMRFVERAKEFLGNLWEGIKNIGRNIAEFFTNIWNGISEGVSNMIGAIRDRFTSIWETIKDIAGRIGQAFSNAWEGIKNSVTAVGEVISGVFNRIFDFIRGIVNGIIGAINGLIRGIVGGINTVLRGLNAISFTTPDWIPLIGGRTFGFNIPLFDAPQIPMLAKGGIVTQPTLAMVGERGREAVLPLENNTGWIENLANAIGAVVGAQLAVEQGQIYSNHAFNHSRPIELHLDGKKLAEATMDDFMGVAERRGLKVFAY